MRQREVLCEGRFMRLVRRGHWEWAERTNARDAVVIVAVTDDGRLLLVEQHRIPVDARVIELPAGLVGDVDRDASVLDTARRELIEETGYDAATFERLVHGPPSAGFGTETVTFVRARGLRKVSAGGGVEHESIVVHEVPLETAEAWLDAARERGALVDPKVYAGLYFATK